MIKWLRSLFFAAKPKQSLQQQDERLRSLVRFTDEEMEMLKKRAPGVYEYVVELRAGEAKRENKDDR
jgi:hypothetical protein